MTKAEIKEQQIKNLRLLLSHFNYSRSQMAENFNVDVSVIHMWFNRGRISAQMAVVAEQLVGGKVTKKMLRPDVKDWMHEDR